LGEAIRCRQIQTISQKVLDYNKGYTKGMSYNDFMQDYEPKKEGTKSKSKKRKNAKDADTNKHESDDIPIHTTKDLRNIYDDGYFSNLWDICFPRQL
jgi:hypothetical protein